MNGQIASTGLSAAELLASPHASGEDIYDWVKDLYPICRSLSGEGVRESIAYIKEKLPELSVHEVPSGEQVLDWTVPDEWNIRGAFIEHEDGERIVDFADNNLHVVGYSEPVECWMELEDLQGHLHSLPDQPEAVPYVTSYYKRTWGFCLSDRRRASLKPGKYHVVIDSTLAPGVLNYADLVLEGREQKEILLTTCFCHPSLANNELSGPCVLTALARWIRDLPDRRFTYRFLWCPETIGSIIYISRHLEHLKAHTKAGYFATCIGDDRVYSHVESRYGDTLSDRVAKHVLHHHAQDFMSYNFLGRGGDERQFCSPGVDLPYSVVTRSKFAEYPEYHTSLDNLDLVTPTGLAGGFEALRKCVATLECDAFYTAIQPGEPQLGKRGLYPLTSTAASGLGVRSMMNFLAYCDGSQSVLDIAERIGLTAIECDGYARKLLEAGVIERTGQPTGRRQ